MSRLSDALLGLEEYFAVNKLVAVCFAIILYEVFVHRRLSRFMKYVMVALLAVLVPVTAAVLIVYQTAIYEHGFIWNIVPVTAVCAYAGVRFLWDMIPQMEQQGKSKYVVGVLAVCGVLFLLGNRGGMQRVTLEEAEERSSYGKVAEALESGTVLWGPREMMQWIRSRNGEVKLVYGMDMWDAAAAAYDGDSYSPELISAYEWMCSLEEYAYQVKITTDAVVPVPEEVSCGLAEAFGTIEAVGGDVIVLPSLAYQCLMEWVPGEYQVQEAAGYTLLQRNE